jgi:butanol dehydrogenase
MTLPEVGITTDELVPEMSAQAVRHGHLTQNAYVSLDNEDVAEIIRASFVEMTDF